VPSNGLCVRKDLDEAIKVRLKNALLNLHNEPEGKEILEKVGALKFIETTATDYQPVFDMANKAGIDMRQYKYRNQ
jgi:ABC-type phosphate/phosphonate transport system substrate-binding protein